MTRVSLILLALAVVFGCKKSTAPEEGGGGGGGGGGGSTASPESTAVYFGITPDSSFVYWDSTTSSSSGTALDTVQTIFYTYITSGGELLVPHVDTFFTSGRTLKDTFHIKGDTVYQYITMVLDTTNPSPDTIRLRYIFGIKPLDIGKSWIPLSPQTQRLNDTIKYPLMATCTLGVRLDSFKVDSSYAYIMDSLSVSVPAGTFRAYKIRGKTHARVFYGLFTIPTGCLPISGDTFATLDTYDTTYIKPYYGVVLTQAKDSTVFNIPPMGSQIETTRRYRALTGKRR